MEKRSPKEDAIASKTLIFKRVESYLLTDRRFVNRQLTRKTIARAVRCNEKYLAASIRECSGGRTLWKFITAMRIDYAKNTLIRHSNYTVEAIAKECGVGSKSAFYRIFREYCGCTPGEYRDMVNKSMITHTDDNCSRF